jgi:hypothetical protein
MTKIGFENEDWESQIEQMLGPDASQVAYKFKNIMDTYENKDYEEPAGFIEIVMSETEVHEWLQQAHYWVTDDDRISEETIANMVWNIGLQLAQLYVDNDSIEPDNNSSEAAVFFLHMPDDMPDLYDNEDDEEE